MIKQIILGMLLAFLMVKSANAEMGNCQNFVVDERLPNIIDKDMKLEATKIYGIDKKVVVTKGATLTIEPGTTLAGCSLFSFLVIAQDARIMARGTKAQPITFTSQMDLLGFSSKNGLGEWGGVVIAGNAYTHYEDNKYEADESIPFGNSSHDYDDESSGILEYVMIKHTGYEVKKDRELNGLSLAGVGSGTTINNIAIIGGKDDGIEIWGGRVNIDGLFVYNAMDDSVDVDLGYQGEIQNVLVIQKKVASKNNHDSSVMEIGNDKNLIITDAKSATLPKIKNLTGYIEGGGIYNKYDAGFRLKNIKLLSAKKSDDEMVFFRGKDSYTTGAKYLDSDVCLYNSQKHESVSDLLSQRNSKGDKKSFTAYDYFLRDANTFGKGGFIVSSKCQGSDNKQVWTGNIGTVESLVPRALRQHAKVSTK